MKPYSLPVWVAALLLPACAAEPPHDIEMMPAPAAYSASVIPGNAHTAGGQEALDILYVTSRAPTSAAAGYYSGERGYLLRAGAATTDVGDGAGAWDVARGQSRALSHRVSAVREFGILHDSVTVFTPADVATRVDEQATREFVHAVEQRLARSNRKDVYIYTHGYRVTFEQPLLVASELWHYLGHEGAFLAFSWPSTPDSLAYMKDTETARVSAWGLRRLLELLRRETSAERIHILGYSAGSRVVLTALHELALVYQQSGEEAARRATRLGNVILVGSDVDTGLVASYILDGLLNVQERLSFYASPSDQALALSRRLFSHRRMGQINPGTLDERMREFVDANTRLALINVAAADHFDEGNGHAYFRNSPWVSNDILVTLRHDLPPAERGLEQPPGSPVWTFPVDYPERFPEL